MANDSSNDQNLFHHSSINEDDVNTTLWAEIILPLAIPKTYTYIVPRHLHIKIKEGCRAEVVFGKNKKYAGIVKSFSQQRPAYETKEILNIIDRQNTISYQLIKDFSNTTYAIPNRLTPRLVNIKLLASF